MQKPRKIPQRQCLGCREMKNKKDLIRVVRNSRDCKGKKPGRGAYVCPEPGCLAKAKKGRALERAFETAVPGEVYDLLEQQMRNESDG